MSSPSRSPLALEVIRVLSDGNARTKLAITDEIVKKHGKPPLAHLQPRYPDMSLSYAMRNVLKSLVRSRHLTRTSERYGAPYQLAEDFSADAFVASTGNKLPTYADATDAAVVGAAARATVSADAEDEPLPSSVASAASDSGAAGPDKSKKRSRDLLSEDSGDSSEDESDDSSDSWSGSSSEDEPADASPDSSSGNEPADSSSGNDSARASKRPRVEEEDEDADPFASVRASMEHLREVHASLLAKKLHHAEKLKEATEAHEAFLRQYSLEVRLSAAESTV